MKWNGYVVYFLMVVWLCGVGGSVEGETEDLRGELALGGGGGGLEGGAGRIPLTEARD